MKNLILFPLIFVAQIVVAQVFPVVTILSSGSNNSRINLVILADGYQSSELPQFEIDAANFANAFFAESPFMEYKNYFNVYAIKVPSAESGASHAGTATDVPEPAHPVSTVNNYFGSKFDLSGIHRLLGITNYSALTGVLAANFPAYDQVIVLVNSPYYGGSGGQYAVSSLNSSAQEIAIHELGHSFVGLKDEYYAGDVYAGEGINMTQETNPSLVKWVNWMGENNIGIFQHCCGGNSALWFRPHQNCKMKALGNPFCSVCKEGTVEKIHSLVNPIESFTPANTGTITLSTPTSFTINLIEPIPNTAKVVWSLNGTAHNNNSNSISLNVNDLTTGTNSLLVTVEDTTALLRINNHSSHVYTVQWTIDKSNLSIEKIEENEFTVELFPNPVHDLLSVRIANADIEKYKIEMVNTAGQVVLQKEIKDHTKATEIGIRDLAPGIYTVNFIFENVVQLTRKLVVK